MTPSRRHRRSQRINGAGQLAEAKHDRALAAYHHYEVASAAVQIAIVLASAAIITGVTVLIWLSGALGIVSLAFILIGFFWPTAVHLF